MSIRIYNLEFPAYIDRLSLGGYTFRRVPEYKDRVRTLHHLFKHFHEFDIDVKFGGHAVTAEVTLPDPEPPPLLKWGKPTATHLDDVLLILSLFTMRHVWAEEGGQGVIIADHRFYQQGWALRQGIPFIEQNQGRIRIDVGFEPGMNGVLKFMSNEDWRARYRGGHYLLLVNHAFRRQILETSFSLCWTIWEHLFALHNDDWLDRQSIHRISGKEKVTFVLSRYGLRGHVNLVDSPSIEELMQVRNRLIHFGMFPEEKSKEKAMAFIKWTEYLIARTLGLYGKETFDSLEKFEAAVNLKGSPQQGTQ